MEKQWYIRLQALLKEPEMMRRSAICRSLLKDAKENAEHVMLVDLARNDLSRFVNEVTVKHYRKVQYFSPCYSSGK